MSGGGALNLSLLSRGIGEVQKNGHEKVEVFLEPSDYYNFAADRPLYLPPIQPGYHHFHDPNSPRISTRSNRDGGAEIPLPKTFTTRKGALLLFSEDMANKTNEQDAPHQHTKKTRRHHPLHASYSAQGALLVDETDTMLKTVDDLAKSILSYGSTKHEYQDDQDKMYLKFIHRRREQWERQIRPGYSAKRYLSTWTRNWDDSVFETVVSKGYLTERSLFHYNLFLPNLRRQLFHEDLSNMPQPYRLMKNMLITPGSLSGYTFYRAPDSREFGALMEEEDEEGEGGRRLSHRPDTKRSIRVIRTTKEGVAKEVSYSALDKDTQREVITDLLVKSAVHYALSKQEEIIEELQSDHGRESSATETSEPVKPASQNAFDMRSAVDSLLDTNRGGPIVLGNELPEVDAQSHSGSDHTGSFKGGAVPNHAIKAMGARQTPRGSWGNAVDDAGREFMGDVPVAAVRDMSAASSSVSSVPNLPPIGSKAPLSPIRDVSRETSQLVTLPPISGNMETSDGMPTVNIMPPTPQLSAMAGYPTPRSDRGDLNRIAEGDPTLAEVSGYNVSSESTSDIAAPAPQTQRFNRKTKNKGPKVSHGARSMAAGSLESKSMKGSMIMAPDGEIISVGGSVGPSRPHDVGVIGDVMQNQNHLHFDPNMTDPESGASDGDEPDEWRATGRGKKSRSMSSKKSDSVKQRAPAKRASQAGRSSVTEQDVLDTLTEHAKRIADSVLSNREAGQNLEADVRNAADMWMDTNSNQGVSRSHSVQGGLKPEAIEDIMREQRGNSEGPSNAEYKELIRQSLTTAVAKAAGLDPTQFPEDAEISPELLEALTNQQLTPDDIQLIRDEETGRAVIKSRAEIAQSLGGVAEGHLYVAPNGKGGSIAGSESGIQRQMSIPADRVSLVDDMNYDVISYGGTDLNSERGRTTGRSKAGSKPGSLAGGTVADLKDIQEARIPKEESPENENDEFKRRLQQMDGKGSKKSSKNGSVVDQTSEPGGASLPSDGGSAKPQLDLDLQSQKSGKAALSAKSDDSKKKAKTPEEPFVVGMPKQKGELSQLYGAQGPGTLPKESKSPVKGKKPKKDGKKGKGKKGKKAKETTPEPPEEVAAPPPPPPVVETKAPVPVPPVAKDPIPPKPLTASSSERPFQSSPENTKTDDEMDFQIVREESSPEPDIPKGTANLPPPTPEEEEEDLIDEEPEDNGDEDNLKSISNREARAAKRAAAAARRKEEVEKRRKEREDQLKREKEEQERQEQLKREMETERRRREEERRLRKQREAEEANREEAAQEEAERKKRLAEAREQRAKEEYQRKLEEMRRKQVAEEAKRMELLMEKQREEEARRAEEELKMSKMEEEERKIYAAKMKIEEEERKKKEEAERKIREEEARKAMEEARRLAEEMARKQAELEARLKFNRALQVEAGGMDYSQDINRAFVFSYFELLQWLGLDIPEFELAKMSQL